MGSQNEIEDGRNLLFSDNSTINQQTSSLKSSEHSLNDGFCEDFSQVPKENNSNGQIELGNTSKILEPTILYPVHDIRTQLLSPETQPRKKDHDSHRDNPGTSHSSPGSLGFPNLGNTCYMYTFGQNYKLTI